MNYYEHHLGDWAAATGHLTWDEDMAYTRLLRAYYHSEQPIQQGQQYRLARATTPAQRRAVDAVIAEFFELIEGHLHQKRADEEIARYQDKQRKAKASANVRWSQSERNANASPNAMRTHSEGNALQTPDTRHQKEKPPKPPASPTASLHRFPPGFDDLWKAYPRKVGKDAASKAFAKRKPDASLLASMLRSVAVQRQSEQWVKDGGQFIPHLSTWLNEGRWQDEPDGAATAVDAVFGGAR